MTIEVRPATVFDDLATMNGPTRPDASVCWCLSYRLLSSVENTSLRGPARGERMRQLVTEDPPRHTTIRFRPISSPVSRLLSPCLIPTAI